jgi:nucleotide-binding universal stress UspA family protein
MTPAPTDDRSHPDGPPLRVLVAVHGYEAPGWAAETARVLATWPWSTVRLLAVLDVPCPPLTSLHGFARRAYWAAKAEWTRLEVTRLQAATDTLLPALPRTTDLVRAPAVRGDLARTVAEHARDWPADVVVVGAPRPGLRSWVWPGPVPQRILRLTGGTVLVTAAPAAVTPRTRRLAVVPRAAAVERSA